MNPDFWRGKRVFLTGHTGFKGSWLSLWLQSLGAEVTGYALAAADEAQPVRGGRSRRGHDLRSSATSAISRPCSRRCMPHDPEIVIHMAAQPLVRYSYQNPVETYATNVMGTVHLLEAVRNTPGRQGGGQCHHRQVLRKPRMGLGLS